MLLYNAKYKLILNLVLFLCIFYVIMLLISQPAYSAEKYNRKSISIMSEVLLVPTAEDITPGRSQELLSAIRLKIKLPRFDYNFMPNSQEKGFWEKSETYFQGTMRSLGSVISSIKEINIQISSVDESIKGVQTEIDRLDKLIKSATEQGSDTSSYKKERDKYNKQKREHQKKRNSLNSQKTNLENQQRALEETLFQQSSVLLSETVSPNITTILTDPDIQKMRAKKYVNEIDKQSFIVSKAKELGIESMDLEKVMDSAYVCLAMLTDYDYGYSRDEKNNKRVLTYNLNGCIIWYKVVMSEDNKQATIELLKPIRTSGSASGDPDETNPYSKVDPDTVIFRSAVSSFVGKLEIETRKIEDFMLKAGVVEVSKSNLGFPLGNCEGLYMGQKFRVYEQIKRGEQIKTKKCGYFYVTNISNNESDPELLSYGKIVISGAEPGMQVKEYPTKGYYFNVYFNKGMMSLKPGTIQTDYYDLIVKKEKEKPVSILSLSADYDLGRSAKIPQLYATIGINVGGASFDKVTIKPFDDEPSNTYLDIHAGIIKKVYIGRIALLIKPLAKYQMFSISNSDDDGNSANFRTNTYSFCPSTGLELALRENFNIGFNLNFNLTLGTTNKWSGSYTPKDGGPTALFDGYITGPDIVYPKILYGGYINIGF